MVLSLKSDRVLGGYFTSRVEVLIAFCSRVLLGVTLCWRTAEVDRASTADPAPCRPTVLKNAFQGGYVPLATDFRSQRIPCTAPVISDPSEGRVLVQMQN